QRDHPVLRRLLRLRLQLLQARSGAAADLLGLPWSGRVLGMELLRPALLGLLIPPRYHCGLRPDSSTICAASLRSSRMKRANASSVALPGSTARSTNMR